ncbi:MAG: addiction module toxin, HicA family [Acidobacteria bacterium 13_1_20CM_3_53_8]|nr:MAG: addiction module toxin, HicA family [Acidobacteria bacterium 13_1_20CM_3_53_8]
MKRRDLIRHLETHGCLFVREGAKHTIYKNPANGLSSTILLLKKFLAHKICDDLGVQRP